MILFKKAQPKSGFTLLELLVAVTIFAMASVISILTVFQINNLTLLNQQRQSIQAEAQNAAQYLAEISRGATDFEYGHIDCYFDGSAYHNPRLLPNCPGTPGPPNDNPQFTKPALGPADSAAWDQTLALKDTPSSIIGDLTVLSFTSADKALRYYVYQQDSFFRVLIYNPVDQVSEVHNLISADSQIGANGASGSFYAEDSIDQRNQQPQYDLAHNLINPSTYFWGKYPLESVDLSFTLKPRVDYSGTDLQWALQKKTTSQTEFHYQNLTAMIHRFQSNQNIDEGASVYNIMVHLGKK